MTREQQQTVTFGIACATFVIWVGFVAWAVVREVQGRRETRASVERLEKLAKARPKQGSATIITPAPSDN